MSDEEEECDCPPEGAPAWMATFSDMATLMLCFFVLLLSFANMDIQNFRTALGSVKEAFGVQFKVRGTFQAMSTSPVELSPKVSGSTLVELTAVDPESLAIVEEFIRSKGLEDALEVDGEARGVIVRAKEAMLFDSGSADLKDGAVPMLRAMSELFGEFSGTLAIEGHTDNRPISTLQFPSNWELSGARAAAVLRYMLADGTDIELVHIAGYADTRPVMSNATTEGRARNRRVEFVFEYDKEHAAAPSNAYDVKALGIATRGGASAAAGPDAGVEGGANDGGTGPSDAGRDGGPPTPRDGGEARD